MRTRPLFLALALVLSLALAGSAVTSARYVRPAAAPPGRYGALQGKQQFISFKVLPNRVVKAFFFSTLMECHNSDTGEDYMRLFDAHDINGGRVDFNGTWRQAYDAESGLREGHGVAEVTFTRGRGVFGSVSVIVPGGGESFETCHGFLDLKMRRGPLS